MSSAKTTIPTVERKVIGNIDWNGFINDFMKEIYIKKIRNYVKIMFECSFAVALVF